MVLGPYSMREDGIYEPVPGCPRVLAEYPAEVLDYLGSHRTTAPGPTATNGAAGDWVWDGSMGSRHDHLRDRIRTWRGFDDDPDSLKRRAVRYIERHHIPLDRPGGEPIDDEELDRMIKGAFSARFHDDPPGPPPTTDAIRAEMQALRQSVAEATASPTRDNEWLVRNLIRPGAVCLLAAQEAVGKSFIRLEIAARGAIGGGALFGYPAFAIERQFRTVLLDEENGEDEEADREDMTISALGTDRSAVGDRYARYSFSGVDLVSPEGRARIEAAVAIDRPDLLILDTATGMVGEEWGAPLKEALQWLRHLAVNQGVAILLIVHLVKPQRDRSGKRQTTNRSLSDVMGQWARPVDMAMVVSGASGEDRVHFDVYKRVPKANLVLARAAGIWTVVASSAAPRIVLPKGVGKTGEAILKAIDDGLDGIDETTIGVSHSGFHGSLKALRESGLVGSGQPYRLTAAGRALVHPESSESPDDDDDPTLDL
jgi:hypothetical protein